MSWVRDDAGLGVPDERSSVQDISVGTSPQVRQQIEKASPKTARDVALRMYQSMKRHGLREEAAKALFEIEEMEEQEDENGVIMKKKKSEELLGMDYLLKDGFVSYLRDMARITPPIPQAGSGKSTLLEVLAGTAKVTKSSILDGTVKYNDKYASEIHLSRLIAYSSGQLNKHIPFLSVRQTLEFARDCTQGLGPENFTPQMRKFFAHALVEGQDPFLEYVLEILSLKEIENKLAGEEISDIDRQKLTTAELALGTYSVMLYDQPFSGSDLVATYDLVDTIRAISRIQQSSAIMSLTQLSEEVFNLFDRIILLSNGHIMYQGPRQDAIPYFAKLGYVKPSYVESHEFLEDIVVGAGSRYCALGAIPLTLDELVECYRVSDHYKDVMRIINGDDMKHTYWVEKLVVAKVSTKIGHSGGIESTGRVQIGDVVTAITMNNEEMQYLSVGPRKTKHERAAHVYSMLKQEQGHIHLQVERYTEEEDEYHTQWEQFQRPFVQTWWKSTKTLVTRQIKITKRLHALIKLRLFQAIVLGLFAGSLFYKLGGQYNQQKMNSVRALGFVSIMSIMLINLVQFPLYMLQRPIFYKHRAKRFFRTSSYVVAHCIVNFPQTFIEALVYTLCVYFLAGLSLAGNVTPFFEYLVLLFLVAYFGSSVFFFLSAISSIPEVGNSLAGLLVSIFLLFSGFVIYPSNVPTYWKWLIYVNPIHWANVLFCKYQFSEGYRDPCSNYRTQLPFCDQFPTMTVGKAYLTFYELSEDAKRTWLPYAILLGWIVLANFLALWGLKNIEFTGTSQSLPYLRKTPKIKDYDDDSESELQTQNTNGNSLDEFSRYSTPQNLYSEHDNPNTSIKEYHIDMEENGIGIPVEPVTLLFENLSFSRCVPPASATTIFQGVLGGSRTSKATLLKCLAGRIPLIGSFNGNLQTNGFVTGASSRLIGYVEKLDAHQPYLSVRESLQFSAALRLGKVISPMNRHIHVELVLNQLGLLPYCNQLVGSLRDATGKTFEIAKKITIAVELAANPSILLLEDPVSGLDTTGTLNILNILSQVSNSGRTIVVSLTHPNARTLSFFDLALILTKEGNQAYFGPTGSNCDKMLEYFTSICKTPPYSRRESPVSYIMGALGLGITKRGSPSINFAEIYKASTLQETNNNEISIIKKFTKNKKSKNPFATYPTPYSLQAVLVLLRTQRFLWRNVQYTYGRLTGCIMIGLLMGSLYFQIEYSDTYGATSRSLYIYMQVILVGVISANNVIPQIGTDRLVYFREKRSGMYLPIFYPLSWAVGEIPYFFIATLAVVGIGNGMAGIGTGSAAEFFKYWIVLFMFTLCVTYFGMMITFLAPVPTLAAFAVSIVTSLWVSASGVVVVLSDIKFYQWMYWTNPFQYAINAMTAISFHCDTKNCGSECRCPRLLDGSYVWDRLATGRSLSYERIEKDILILSAMCVLFSSLAFLFFVVLKHNSPPNV
ncbi:hypothetical protein Patl1_23940 [Pistacia atlantica]|uniref:Uncharacterized protein n=1 Tax=Pistacia atlantica TaxID=434234 RepID=A0ACC0ZTF4_9ROSI|nr:hypothetical protein Patl1_23940 [Pistacia atlantica]